MKLFFATVLLLASTLAHAIIDEVPDWVSVQVETVVDRQNVSVAARVGNGTLVTLTVELAGKTIDVPPSELADLPALNLQSIRVVSPDVKSDTGPKVRVELEGSPNRDPKQKNYVQFLFSGQSYQGRIVEKSLGNARTRELKEAGQPARPMK